MGYIVSPLLTITYKMKHFPRPQVKSWGIWKNMDDGSAELLAECHNKEVAYTLLEMLIKNSGGPKL